MRAVVLVFCVFVRHFVSGKSVIDEQDVTLSRKFPPFFRDFEPTPFEKNFDFTPYDTIFSSWLPPAPDFHMLAEFPPIMNVPRIQVFCDESHLSVLVDKSVNGATLTAEEVQLGNGCYSNRERPNQVVFTYSVDECGTTQKMQNGLVAIINSVHFNLRTPLTTWSQIPSTVHVSCIPKRSTFTAVSSENDKIFNIKAMDSSWISAAETNVYKRGQGVNLQVYANTGPGEQLFIQSCFVSPSPDPQSKPRHSVIMNKGCTGHLNSHPVAQFVASSRGDVVNFVLNTTYQMTEIYIHCTALISDQGVTPASKSCNYNLIKSRWEDLSGYVEVCKCCSSKCKGSPGKHHEGFRATLSTGPFVIMDKNVKMTSTPDVSEQQQPLPALFMDAMQSDAADTITSGASLSRSKLSSPPQGVVVASQDPLSSLTLWLPGQVKDSEHSKNDSSETDSLTSELKELNMSNDLPESQPLFHLNPPTDGIDDQNELKGDGSFLDLNLLMMVDGWPIPPNEADSMRQRRSGMLDKVIPQVDILVPAEMSMNDFKNVNLDLMDDEPSLRVEAAEKSQEHSTDEAIIRSKLQFSKSADGTQTLSYEKQVVKSEAKPAINGRGMDLCEGKQKPKQKGLRSAFLDFLRRMDKAE